MAYNETSNRICNVMCSNCKRVESKVHKVRRMRKSSYNFVCSVKLREIESWYKAKELSAANEMTWYEK
ncbi:hypothetical protein bcgnr5406_50530 [Bacillus cereus]|nr:hypothetical protein BCM0075_1312 [Bacillus cereus]BCD08736.1 hypothetical protein BC30052_p2018 [Bacillus cereus]